VVNPNQVAAIIVEVIQGEGGFNPIPAGYLQGLREFCDRHGIVLIFDEVQSGFCRTGKWAAYEHYSVRPDLSTWAKSMGSGMPLGCVIGKAEVMDGAEPGTIGGTYLGNPVSCAAGIATIDYMKSIDLNSRAVEVGKILETRLKALQAKIPAIGDVRGLGAMIAFELVKNGDPRQADYELCHALTDACLERGLLLLSAGTHKNVVRILCPLVIEDEKLDEGLRIIEQELTKLTTK
jgi:4-aminobutyrate aminotransferase/(S)-3-amino-2-methylpropionate transaminase